MICSEPVLETAEQSHGGPKTEPLHDKKWVQNVNFGIRKQWAGSGFHLKVNTPGFVLATEDQMSPGSFMADLLLTTADWIHRQVLTKVSLTHYPQSMECSRPPSIYELNENQKTLFGTAKVSSNIRGYSHVDGFRVFSVSLLASLPVSVGSLSCI